MKNLVSMQCRMSNVDVRVLSTNTASLRCHTRPDVHVRLGEHRSKVVRSQKDVEAVAVAVGLEGGGAGRGRLVKLKAKIEPKIERDWRRRIER